MSWRPATCLTAPFVAILAVLALTGCGGGGHEAPAPPRAVASSPTENPEPTPAETSAPDADLKAPPVAAPSVAAPSVAAPSAGATSTGSASDPAFTPGTSLPGAIPPSPASDANPNPPGKPVDALQLLEESEAHRADYNRRLAEAEASLTGASAPVATWERNILAFKNPFLPRPQLSPEDAQAIVGKDGGERVQWAEGRLAEARTARDAAQKTLDDLRANPPPN